MNNSILFRRIFLIIFTFSFFAAAFSHAKAAESDKLNDVILAKVGSENITYGELESAYKKNMNRDKANLEKIPRDSLEEFLDLYINYRLKVHDAIQRGFEKDSAVVADIKQNRQLLSESFYYDNELVKKNVAEMLDRREWEYKVAIILIGYDSPNPSPEDSAKVYQEAQETLKKLREGADFGQMAKEVSDDKESAKNDGVISAWITSGKVQRPIEDAIFSVKEAGKIYPGLVDTRYGYFIIKVIRRETREFIRGSHILLSEGMPNDSTAVKKRADSILNLIKSGEKTFEEAAEEFSDDPATAMNGGDLGVWYSRSGGLGESGRNLAPPFEEALYSLKDGQISGVVQTDFGYHIIRRDSTKQMDPDEEKEDLRMTYKRLYFENDKRNLLDSLKDDYGYEPYVIVMDKFLNSIDSSKTNLTQNWDENIPEELMDKPLFKIADETFTVSEFIKEFNSNNNFRGFPLDRKGVNRAIEKITDEIAFNKATKDLESDYPEFRALMKEFRDGILLFRVEAMEVWDKLKFDSTLARKYYDTTKSNYMTEPTYDISEIYVISDTLANEIYDKLKDGADFAELAAEFTQRSGFREKEGKRGKLVPGKSDLADLAEEKGMKAGDISDPIEYDRGYVILKVNEFAPVRQKTFEEAIPDFAPDFQDLVQKDLSKKWLSQLREKYSVKIYDDNIEKIYKN